MAIKKAKRGRPKKSTTVVVKYTNQDFFEVVSEFTMRAFVNSLQDIKLVQSTLKREGFTKMIKDFIIEQLDWAVPDIETPEYIEMRDSIIKRYTDMLRTQSSVALKKIK